MTAGVAPLLLAVALLPGFCLGKIDLAAYDEFVRTTLSPVHATLARQVATDYGVTDGRVLEVAFGAPYLSLELARLTLAEFDVLVETGEEADLCRRRVDEAGMTPRFHVVTGRAGALPYDTGTFDLVLARDAMRFWPSKAAAFSEIQRVLKPGALAFLGGGLGRTWTGRAAARLWADVQLWRNETGSTPWAASLPYPERLEAALDTTGISDYRVWTEGGYCNCRTWVEWNKLPPLAEIVSPREPGPTAEPPVGQAAPDFALAGIGGDTVRLSALKGTVVVLDFWGVDCRACLNMMAGLEPFWRSLEPGSYRVLAVNIDADRGLFLDFVDRAVDPGYEMLYDDAGVAGSYGIRGLPHFVVVDRNGTIRARIKGGTPQHVEDVRSAVRTLLAP